MTLFHFGNCVALAYVPYFITYKYSGLSVGKCAQAGIAYFVTQLAKLLVLATFFPAHEHEGERFDFTGDALKATVDLMDIIGLYLVISKGLSGKGEARFLAGGLGWATADLVATRLLPFWVGARGIEFDWKYLQMALESNINLINFMAVATLVWLWSRADLNASIYPVISAILVFSAYRQLLFSILFHVFSLASWLLLVVKAVITIAVGVLTLNIFAVCQRRDSGYYG